MTAAQWNVAEVGLGAGSGSDFGRAAGVLALIVLIVALAAALAPHRVDRDDTGSAG